MVNSQGNQESHRSQPKPNAVPSIFTNSTRNLKQMYLILFRNINFKQCYH